MSKSGIWGKDGRCHICQVIYTPSFLVCKCSFYHLCPIFATYLQGANLGKSIFRPAFYLAVYFKEEK